MAEKDSSLSSFTDKFTAVYDSMDELTRDPADLHRHISVNDKQSRHLFTSLSRFLALSDQVQMTLSLMREEARAMERASWERVNLLEVDHLEDRVLDWFYANQAADAKVN